MTGESPIVDVQNASVQRVMQKEVFDAIPVGRSHQSLAILIPGLSTTAGINPVVQDVGGTNNLRLANAFTIHGGRTTDSNIQIDGFQIRNIGSFGNLTNMFPDMGATQEMTIDYAAGMADVATGGVKINYIPREGGNTLRGSFFGTGVNSSFQADNFSEDLRARGLTQVNSLKKAYDINGSIGGPIVRDKLLVLRLGAPAGERHVFRRPLRQPERGRSDEVELRARPLAAGRHLHHPARHQRPRHLAGEREEQVRLLLHAPAPRRLRRSRLGVT